MALPLPTRSLLGGNLFETLLSAAIVMLAAAFTVFLFIQTGTGHLGSYGLTVNLRNAAGLVVGSDVRLSGKKIGSVTALDLDRKNYRALVSITVRDDLFLPVDSDAAIAYPPFGDIYLTVSPGKATRMVTPGGTLGRPAAAPPARPVS